MTTDPSAPLNWQPPTREEVFELERQMFAPGGDEHHRLGDERYAQLAADRESLHTAVRHLIQARLAAGLTLEQVAKRSGCSLSWVEALEAMAALDPDWLRLTSYARAVGCRLVITGSPAADTPYVVGYGANPGRH